MVIETKIQLRTVTSTLEEPPMPNAQTLAEPLQGQAFDMSDLRAAIAWAALHPVRLIVATDHSALPEAIEVSLYGDRHAPRWMVWRDLGGRLVLDAIMDGEFGLRFADMADALGFIAAELSTDTVAV